MDLSLRFEDNGTAHDDIVLRFGGQTWISDSYYFALDGALQPESEDPLKVKAVFRRLLEQWLGAVENMPDGGTVFLPYDFSDQYTGWLRCQRSGGEVSASRGWSYVEGWSFFPSAVGEYLAEMPGFQIDGPTVRASVEELLEDIRNSLARVA